MCPLLLILHWPKQVTWAGLALEEGDKKYPLQERAGREGSGKGRVANILTVTYCLLQYIFGCSDITKSFPRFFEGYSKLEVGTEGLQSMPSNILSTYELHLYYHFGDLGRQWV